MTDFYFEMPTTGQISLAPFADAWGKFTFKFSICSSTDANDGALPYGDKISSIAVFAYEDELQNSVDVLTAVAISDLIDTGAAAPVIVGKDTVQVQLQYPAAYTGIATLYFQLTLDSGAKQGFLFRKVQIG